MTLVSGIDLRPISGNIDRPRLDKYFEHVESRYIVPLLGQELYDDLLDEDSDNRTNNLLLIEKLNPAIQHYVYGELMMHEQDKMTPTGLVNKVNEYSQPVSGNALMYKYQKSCRDAEFYISETVDFLTEKKDDFPLWIRNKVKSSCKNINIGFI